MKKIWAWLDEMPDGSFMTRKATIFGILTFLVMPAWIGITALTSHEPPAGKPFQLSPAAETRIAELRGRADVIYNRLSSAAKENAAAFERAMNETDEADKLYAEADAIDRAEFDKWIDDAVNAQGSQGAK
jgi:hypothetical protein